MRISASTRRQLRRPDLPHRRGVRMSAPAVLVVMCSERKRDLGGDRVCNAWELYDGPLWQDLRLHRLAGLLEGVSVFALSARYGLVPADMRTLRPYEQRLDDTSAATCGSSWAGQLHAICADASECYLAVGGLYHLALGSFRARPPCRLIDGRGEIGHMRRRLRGWLTGRRRPLFLAAVGNRDSIKVNGERRPFWELLGEQPDGWLCSLAYDRSDVPTTGVQVRDCGAWSYRKSPEPELFGERVTPAWAVERYGRSAPPGALVISPDHMLVPGLGDLRRRREINEANASEFILRCHGTGLVPMACVHGETDEERATTARRYADLGYRHLAIGGLAGQASRRRECVAAVAAVRTAVPVHLHVLGLSSPGYAAHWARLGVQQFDGASHFRQAFTCGRFFVADGPRLQHFQAARDGEAVTAPLCRCLTCETLASEGIDTRRYGSNESNMGRAAHNLGQLIRAIGEAVSDASAHASYAEAA